MTGLVRRLVARIAGGSGGPGGVGGAGLGAGVSPFLARRLREAEEALRGVVIPGYDVDVVSSGVVVKIRVSLDAAKILVAIDYQGRNPGCSFCRFISDTLWTRVFKDIEEALRKAGYREVYITDYYTGALLHPPPNK